MILSAMVLLLCPNLELATKPGNEATYSDHGNESDATRTHKPQTVTAGPAGLARNIDVVKTHMHVPTLCYIT